MSTEPSAEQPPETKRFALKRAYHRLWFEFLLISPSYELARRWHAGEWNDDDEKRRPSDFDRVLEVYQDLGDVRQLTFEDWWNTKAVHVFGYEGEPPRVRRIAKFSVDTDGTPKFSGYIKRYRDEIWPAQGRQNTMLVAIPVGLPKSLILKNIEQLLGTYADEERHLQYREPKYILNGKRQDYRSLVRYYQAVSLKILRPKDRLWRIGLLAEVSTMYAGRLRPDEKPKHGEKSKDREVLKFLTNRAIYRGRMIAENAARGVFPSYSKCPNAAKLDEQEARRLFQARRRWKRAQQAAADAKASADQDNEGMGEA